MTYLPELWAASHVVSSALRLGADDANARQKLMVQLRHLLGGLFFTAITIMAGFLLARMGSPNIRCFGGAIPAWTEKFPVQS
jgi:hypothetical protein